MGYLETPPPFMVFDLLQLGEKDYRLEPLKVRRKALEKLVKGQTLVAKDAESPYMAGRTLKWLKIKQPKYREEERGFYKP